MKVFDKNLFLSQGNIRECFYAFCKLPFLHSREQLEYIDNPYWRPVYFEEKWIDEILINSELRTKQVLFFAQKILFNIYEQDLLFLPKEINDEKYCHYLSFYEESGRTLGKIIKPFLERYLYAFLDKDIDVSGTWTAEDLMNYFYNDLKDFSTTESLALKVTLSSLNPKRALQNYLIQCCGDFLTEASGMSRNVLGNYGSIQSELFKVLIDEYGYGVHATKHSTLFEKLLNDQNLSESPHAYWNYYLESSLNIHNYIHYVSENHTNFFKYIGALYYAEATYPHICSQISSTIKQILGESAETTYFDEHVHIDNYHMHMVLNKIITPILNRYGNRFIEDIVRGYEEFKLILSALDQDYIDQIYLIDKVQPIEKVDSKTIFLKEKKQGNASIVSNEDEFLMNDKNYPVTIYYGYDAQVHLKTNTGVFLPKGRLYGYVN